MSWGNTSISSPVSNYTESLSNSWCSSLSTYTNTSMSSPESLLRSPPPDGPYLEITEQTVPTFRFRYESEMQGTHGAIQGVNSTKKKKTFPSVRLCNFHGEAVIRCTLYAADKKGLHVHRLIQKSRKGSEKLDPHDVFVGPSSNPVKNQDPFLACFQNLVIIHVAKWDFVKELVDKKVRIIKANNPNSPDIVTPHLLNKLKMESTEEVKKMDMNCAVLKFEALYLENGNYVPMHNCEPVYSNNIKNLKSHVHGNLKICRMDKVSGSCEGNDELFLLVEKVGKDNIRVVMTEYDENGSQVWSDYCKFSASDVHHQFAIVCRTPKYRYTDIDDKISLYIQLERITDKARSEPREFTYLPSNNFYSIENVNPKRKRIDSDSMSNFSVVSPPIQQFPSSPKQISPVSTANDLSHDFNSFTTNANEFNIPNQMWGMDYIELNSNQYNDNKLNSPEDFEGERNNSLTKLLNALPTPDICQMKGFFNYEEIEKVINEQNFNMGDQSGFFIMDSSLLTTDGRKRHNNINKTAKIITSNEKTEIVDFKLPVITINRANKFIEKFGDEAVKGNYLNHLKDKTNILENNQDSIEKILSTTNLHGNKSIHCAIIYKQIKNLQLLVDIFQKLNKIYLLNQRNDHLQTPLHLAVQNDDKDHIRMVEILLNGGADPNIKDSYGLNPLQIAIQSNLNHKLISVLLESPLIDINSHCDNGCTALYLAVENNKIELVEKLISSGADVNCIHKKTGRTVLHIAVINKNYEMVALLLKQCNFQIDKKDFNGDTPLKLLLLNEFLPSQKIFNIFKKNGAIIDNKSCKNVTRSCGNGVESGNKSEFSDLNINELFQSMLKIQ